jgi:hypothetical protein
MVPALATVEMSLAAGNPQVTAGPALSNNPGSVLPPKLEAQTRASVPAAIRVIHATTCVLSDIPPLPLSYRPWFRPCANVGPDCVQVWRPALGKFLAWP